MSVSFAFTQKNDYKYLPSTEYLRYTSINYLFLAFILFENLFKPRQLPSATSKQCFEQPAASFLVCILIFIEYKKIRLKRIFLERNHYGSTAD